nr:hypothetical protein [Bacillus toyonensis]
MQLVPYRIHGITVHNGGILVYFHSLDFIEFITTYSFSLKPLTKVYIQIIDNKKAEIMHEFMTQLFYSYNYFS